MLIFTIKLIQYFKKFLYKKLQMYLFFVRPPRDDINERNRFSGGEGFGGRGFGGRGGRGRGGRRPR